MVQLNVNLDGGDLSLVKLKGVFGIDENISEFNCDFTEKAVNKSLGSENNNRNRGCKNNI